MIRQCTDCPKAPGLKTMMVLISGRRQAPRAQHPLTVLLCMPCSSAHLHTEPNGG